MAASIAQILGQLPGWASDAVLLERYLHQRDEAAFAALVARHGALVLRLCRRILGDAHAAEDAFQATFLILAQKARSLKQPDALPAWLYGVARRVALKARGPATGRAAVPLDDTLADPCPDPLTQLTAREVLEILDEEVRRLPASQQSAFVLCCLEGHTQDEAARMLGCTVGSIKGRLERGRRRLQIRLRRHGIVLSAALAFMAVARDQVSARVPGLLLHSTVRSAAGGGVSSAASALAHSVLKTMLLSKLAGVLTVVLTAALAASATVALVYRAPKAEAPEDKRPAIPAAAKQVETRKPEPRTDAWGDPLPEGAIARLGTVRFRPGDTITCLRFTPDGRRLVSQGSDGIRVWDAVTGKELRHLDYEKKWGYSWGHGNLSPDGKLLAVWGREPPNPTEPCPLEIWDVESGKKIGTLVVERNVSPISHSLIRFSPDGKYLATSAINTDVQMWDVATRKKVRSWRADPQSVWNIVFSLDSHKLITVGSTGAFRLWDVASGRLLLTSTPLDWKGIANELETALAPDGKLLASIESNEKRVLPSGKVEWKARIGLRDTTTGKLVRQLVCPAYDIVPGSPRPFRALTFTADGKSLITSGPDHFVRIWDPNTGEELRRLLLEELPGSLALSPDGKKLAVVILWGRAIRVVDLTSGQALMPPGGHLMEVSQAVLTPDGRTAVTGSPVGPLLVWDVANQRVRRRLQGQDSPVVEMRLGSDGRTLFTLGWDKTLRVWDVATGVERRRIPVEHDCGRLQRSGLALTSDGKTLAVVDSTKTIRILDAASGAERQRFPEPERLLGMRLSPDGRSLIGWSGDFKLHVWDTATGRKLREYPVAQGNGIDSARIPNAYYNFALSHDGRLLAIGLTTDRREKEKPPGYLILQDVETGRVVHRIDHLPSEPRLVAFSPDDRMLAWSGFMDHALRLLEVAGGHERRRLVGHRGAIDDALAFSADGRRLLCGCTDTTALVWDLIGDRTGRPSAAELAALWADLGGEDAARAYQAIHRLAAAPDIAIPFLRKHLRVVPTVDAKQLDRWIADLDSDDFTTRQKSMTELEKQGEQALPAYRKALGSRPSLESRRRLEELLEKAQRAWWDVSGERLRSLRAVEALEWTGTPEARKALETLAAGAEGARLTGEARAALQRMVKTGGN